MEIKRLKLTLIGLFFFWLPGISQLIDTSVLTSDIFSKVNKNTQEAAITAPQSKLYGIWYLQSGNSYYQINPDGRGSLNTLADLCKGIKIVWSQKFLWKKEKGLFRVKFVGEAKYTLAEDDETKYANLSRSEKDQLLNYLKSLHPHTLDSNPMECQILLLNDNIIILREGNKNIMMVKRNYINHLKIEKQKEEEEKIRRKAEEEAQALAEEKAIADAKAKAQAEKEVQDNIRTAEMLIQRDKDSRKNALAREGAYQEAKRKAAEALAQSKSDFMTYAQKMGLFYIIENDIVTIPLKKKNKTITINFKNYVFTTPDGDTKFEGFYYWELGGEGCMDVIEDERDYFKRGDEKLRDVRIWPTLTVARASGKQVTYEYKNKP